MLQERVVAIAADYADALLVARRAKRAILLLLVILLLAQLAIFATAHFAPDLLTPSATLATAATSQPTANWSDFLHYGSAISLWLAMILSILLLLVLFLTIHIMLVGRLIGVAYVTKAFTLAILVTLLLLPWQTLLVTRELSKSDLVLPVALYTWREVEDRVVGQRSARANATMPERTLYWARFAGFPLATLVMLLVVQVRSGRGLKLALGEEELLPTDEGLITR